MDDADFGSKEAGKKGGLARAESLSKADRSAIAREAAITRWERQGHSPLPIATHGSPDRPLCIGNAKIPCYVLDSEQRVITLRGMLTAMGMKKGSGEGGEGGNRLARFATGKSVAPFVSDETRRVITHPLKFRLPGNRGDAYGYEATILADLCEAVLEARKAGALRTHQSHIADQCEILMRAFARVGIIALVDEATGFQDDRAKLALAKILEAFVAKELRKWLRTFPSDFYKQMCRLRDEPYDGTMKHPRYFGKLTNEIVYRRLAPGVLDELQRKNPADEAGRRKHRHFQWLTDDVGHPKLREHLAAVTAIMKLATDGDWDAFVKMLDRALPVHIDMPLFDQAEPSAIQAT